MRVQGKGGSTLTLVDMAASMKALSPPFEWAAAGADGHLYSRSGCFHLPGALPLQPSGEAAGSMVVPANPANDQQSIAVGC